MAFSGAMSTGMQASGGMQASTMQGQAVGGMQQMGMQQMGTMQQHQMGQMGQQPVGQMVHMMGARSGGSLQFSGTAVPDQSRGARQTLHDVTWVVRRGAKIICYV